MSSRKRVLRWTGLLAVLTGLSAAALEFYTVRASSLEQLAAQVRPGMALEEAEVILGKPSGWGLMLSSRLWQDGAVTVEARLSGTRTSRNRVVTSIEVHRVPLLDRLRGLALRRWLGL